MLKAYDPNDPFIKYVLSKPNFLEWEYEVKIEGIRDILRGDTVLSINVSGQLQSQFTVGSSLSKSLDLDLLLSERANIKECARIDVTVFLKIEKERHAINIGTFYATEVDRQTIGHLKIHAIDAMGHSDKLSSKVVRTIFPKDTNVGKIVDAIAGEVSMTSKISSEYYKREISNFNAIDPEFSYREMLEILAGFCGCNVRITNDQCIEFFKFTDTGITLTKDNYYNMTKGHYPFIPTSIECTPNEGSPIVIGTVKENSVIRFSNPYITQKSQLQPMYEELCYYPGKRSGFVEYYATTADIIGTCLFEPGDIVTIEDRYGDKHKIYIQDYKLTCNNGIKETLTCYFDYNKGKVSNSINNKIDRLNNEITDTRTYISDNFVTNAEFQTIVKGVTTNVEYANDGLDKWLVEYYKLGLDENNYDREAIVGRVYERQELIEDGPTLESGRIYENTLCKFTTGIYVVPKDKESVTHSAIFKTSNDVKVYLNGSNIVQISNEDDEYPITFQSGWNIVEIYKGGKDVDSIITSFTLKYDNESEYPFYHITSTITKAEKDEEEKREEEQNKPGENPEEVPEEKPEELPDEETPEPNPDENPNENVMPIDETNPEETPKEEESDETLYRRFSFIRLVNPYAIDINYKRITDVERLTTVDSIIDRITQTEIFDEELGENVPAAELIIRESKVVQEIDRISSTISEYEKTLESTEEKMSDVTQTVDQFKLTFSTAIYGNYLSNSGFATDDPLSGFEYTIPGGLKSGHVFTYRHDKVLKDGNTESTTVDENAIDSYGHKYISINSNAINTGFKGIVSTESEDNYQSSNRTLSMGSDFKISQTFYKESENFPYYKNNDTGEYYQFFLSLKAKRSKNCIVQSRDGYYLYPRLVMTIRADYPQTELPDGSVSSFTVIDNVLGLPSKNEGIVEYGYNIDLDVIEYLDDYEIGTEWKEIDFIADLPKEVFDNVNVKSFTVTFETQYWPSVANSYIESFENNPENSYKEIHDIKEYTDEDKITQHDSIFICEPMFGTTKNYLPLPYTNKQSELITGVTNITQDGIQISRSDSYLTTEIKNNGMAILYDGEMVAQFKQEALVPVLKVTKDLTAPTIYYNKNDIPDIIEVGDCFQNDPDVVVGKCDKIYPKYVYFNDLTKSLWSYGILRKDKVKIIIKANPDIEKQGKHVYPGGNNYYYDAFIISDIKCGILEIELESDVVLAKPIVLKNVEGTVKIRGPIDKSDVVIDDSYWTGNDEGLSVAPAVPLIIAHNVRWVEVWGLNFSGGHNYATLTYDYDYGTGLKYSEKDRNYYLPSNSNSPLKGETFKTVGEFLQRQLEYYVLNFRELYANMTPEEENDIYNKVAVFIGYCWCADISRCNLPRVSRSNRFYSGSIRYDIGIYGDHCDCYLFNNQGETGSYYKNRDKCWFRLPIISDEDIYSPEEDDDIFENGTPNLEEDAFNNKTGDTDNPINGPEAGEPQVPDSTGIVRIDLMDYIYPGGMIRKERTTGTALDHCFLGTSRDLVYLGSLLYDSAPVNSYDGTMSVPGSNLTGYSRIKKGVNLNSLHALYDNSNGKFFGASSSLPAVSYSPRDTEDAIYTTKEDCKFTSLYNALGFSVTMPDMKETMETRTLISAKLRIGFETENGKLVEYGNQHAFSDTNDIVAYSETSGKQTRGGGVMATTNQSIPFGVRFVYDESHHEGEELSKGYYNMGRSGIAHEVLQTCNVGKAINSWVIEGDNTIHNIKNFDYAMSSSIPFIAGQNPFIEDELKTFVEIDLAMITPEWFDDSFKNSYGASKNGIDKDSFFNSLLGLSTGALKYIDIAPVGVWDSMSADTNYPSMNYIHHFNYDITGEQKSYISLSTSCFKVTEAQLILELKDKEIETPECTITINYVDLNGNPIPGLETVTIKAPLGSIYNISGNYKPDKFGNYRYDSYRGDNISGTLDEDKEITLVYEYYDPQHYVYVYYVDPNGRHVKETHQEGPYSKGTPYDVTEYDKVPIEGYTYRYTDGDPLSGTINGMKKIYVHYVQNSQPEEPGEGDYTLTVKYILDWYKNGLDSTDEVSVSPTITKRISIGQQYDLTPYIDDHVLKDYNSLKYEFCKYDTDYEINPDGSQGEPPIKGKVRGDIVLNVYYKRCYQYTPGVDMFLPAAAYGSGGSTSEDKFETKFVTMNDAYVGVLSRTNTNTVNETYYYRQDSNGDFYDPVGFATVGYDNYTGNMHNGFEYTFNADTLRSNFKNANNIYLDITFSKKSYGPTDFDGENCTSEDLYYYVKLTIGKTERLQGIVTGSTNFDDPGLHAAHSCIELDNKNDTPTILTCNYYHGSSRSFDRFDSNNNDLTPFVVSGCLANASGTHTQRIKLNDIVFPTPWKDIINDLYDEEPGYALDSNVFTNLDEVVRKGKLISVQIYPTDFHYELESYDDRPDPASHQCLKILEVKLTTE